MWREVVRFRIYFKANRICWHIGLGRNAVRESRMAPRFLGQLTLRRSYLGLGFQANLPWEELYWGVKLGFE